MLKTENLAFAYDEANRFDFPNFSCAANEHLLILGASGCGKTTLLHLLAGLLEPAAGSVSLGETALSKLSDKKRDAFRGAHIGIVFQKAYFVSALTVSENLLAAAYFSGQKQDKARVAALLDRLNLAKKGNKKAHELSLGEQQRVSIARALVNKPQLILADEPSSSLDDKNCAYVLDLLEEQAAIEQSSLVIVTHDSRVKDKISKRVEL